MKTNRLIYLLVACFISGLSILQIGCKKDEKKQEEKPVAEVSENTKVIEQTDWQNSIVSYDTSNYTFYFNDNIEDMNLKTGDIIVSAADEGILRKVSEIFDEEGMIIVQTEDADLEDAISNGEFIIEEPLTLSNIKSIEYNYKGIKLDTNYLKQMDNTNFSWGINAIIYDADEDTSTTWDQIRLVGTFSCSWDIYMSVTIKWLKLQKVRIGFEASEDLSLNLIAGLEYNFDKSVNLMTVNFNPITVYIAGCPVVVTPVLKINAGIDGYANANITTSITQGLSFDAGIEYNSGSGWSTDKTFDKSFTYSPPQLNVNAGAEAYLEPELIVKIYGVKGPYITTRIYGKLEADLLQSPWWTLSGGLNLSAGAKVKKFGKTFFDKHYDGLITYEVQIAQSSTPPPSMPTVSTTPISNITETTATGGGDITDEGSSTVTGRGVCWSTMENPTLNNSHTSDGIGIGLFTSQLSGLSSYTTYYIRAYATNSDGTAYGNQLSFVTEGNEPGEPCPGIPTVYYEGQTYNTVQIGTQCWFKENLNVGTMINGSNNQTNNGQIEKYCCYDEPANCTTYGGLYQWDEMMQYTTLQGTQGICPTGWHMPTDDEWIILTDFLGGEEIAGGPLKEAGTAHWLPPNTGATNETGFTALPGANRHGNGTFGTIGYDGNWWSSTQSSTSEAWHRRIQNHQNSVQKDYNYKTLGFSIRCLQDN